MAAVIGTLNDPVVCVRLAAAEPDLLAPGMLVIVDGEGCITACEEEYDVRVAGVVSGPGNVGAVILDATADGVPVALLGTSWAWADAGAGAIAYGDMLTTSTKLGHARVATDRSRAFGAVVGKALTALPAGTGLVRVLLTPR
ncbi:MAG TPA: hypothetical protein VFJ94_04900 [Intrasporangium sp.]|uniref:hypothetical protein n=1 Tax=Intrasporangium sp. TaxID=1925024 RepID=UPI002D79C552|nr:hypothetical protein [Intrasporangium sp.]HET7397840.1 hypothetical protein [Intrasporangium sp.]